MTTALASRAEQSIACALNRAAGTRPVPGNQVELLIDGPDAYARMMEVIERAERWIHFENYIIRGDTVGRRFADALIGKARAGIQVRVLYDWLGSFWTPRSYWRRLRDAGIEVRAFHPPRLTNIVTNASRNHRKLVLSDGCRAVTGGLCIGCEWTGEEAHGGQAWRDTGVAIHGPAAAILDQAFVRTWSVAGGTVPDDLTTGSVARAGDAELRVIVGEPGRERVFRVIEMLAAGCMERLWVTDAYLVPPPRLLQVLRDAAADGVDVRLLVPGTSDIPFVRNLSRIGYRDLLRAGVRIYEWDGPMLHAKTILCDSRWVRIGSSNLNPSSLLGNYELDVLIDDPGIAELLEHQFRRDVARSREVSVRPRRGPRRISDALPPAFTRLDPEVAPERGRTGRRRRRGRAALALRTLVASARRGVYGRLAVVLVVLGALFLVLPRIMGYVLGATFVWLSIAATREAFRRRSG